MAELSGSASPPSDAFDKNSSACSAVIEKGEPSTVRFELRRIDEKNCRILKYFVLFLYEINLKFQPEIQIRTKLMEKLVIAE